MTAEHLLEAPAVRSALPSVLRVLLIEGNEKDYLRLRELLEEMGDPPMVLTWVTSWETGQAALRHNIHHLCLLDYRVVGPRAAALLDRRAQSLDQMPPTILLIPPGVSAAQGELLGRGGLDCLSCEQLNPVSLRRSVLRSLDRAAEKGFAERLESDH